MQRGQWGQVGDAVARSIERGQVGEVLHTFQRHNRRVGAVHTHDRGKVQIAEDLRGGVDLQLVRDAGRQGRTLEMDVNVGAQLEGSAEGHRITFPGGGIGEAEVIDAGFGGDLARFDAHSGDSGELRRVPQPVRHRKGCGGVGLDGLRKLLTGRIEGNQTGETAQGGDVGHTITGDVEVDQTGQRGQGCDPRETGSGQVQRRQ